MRSWTRCLEHTPRALNASHALPIAAQPIAAARLPAWAQCLLLPMRTRLHTVCWILEAAQESAPVATEMLGHLCSDLLMTFRWDKLCRRPMSVCILGRSLPADAK